ncbi:NACHT domain-containing protein [Actinacidiphila paucisporea]|uniref:NACHT domain-containing protein n=1 Tax=Actinacidiphila paucisporea TaxID=310782 RepID=A0A1M7QEN9_9ACTN|nr:NACHT domain-containing protein [Actinacidiphila paucisporea]SHN29090.1 NACHT domain-containing protein [Actinacidiphila paucisporea]
MAGRALQLVSRFGLLTVAAVVPSTAAVRYHSSVAHHRVLAAGLLVGYEVVLVAVGFAGKVFAGLQAKWVERAVENVDRRLAWRFSRLQQVYLGQLRTSVQTMETVGVGTPGEFVLRMHQVYVDVSLARQVPHATAGEPYLGTVPGSEAAAGMRQRHSLESVLQKADREKFAQVLAVIGGPGSGKTTLARDTALALCERRWRWSRRRLPVLLYLRDHAQGLLAEQPPGLAEVTASAVWLGGKVPADWLERRLNRGGCVVLLDGLDEVADPADRSRVVAWVERQIARHPRNIYVVTSRPHGYQANPLTAAEVLQVRRFTPEQIERFLHLWSYAVESRAQDSTGPAVRRAADQYAQDLMRRLRAKPALYGLAANPLLLTMTANVHRYRGALPGSRAELYAEMCDVLLHRRSEARGLSDATGLTGPQKQDIVRHLALAMMKAKVRDWPAPDAARAIRRPLRQVPGDVTAEVFLDEARKSGLLVEREHGVYGFAHLSLQEYLASAQLSTPRADTGVLTGSVDDSWWRETILLWSAGNDATDIVTACLRANNVSALALAFDCDEQARTLDPTVRDNLNALLTPIPPDRPDEPTRRRLLAGVQATRTLRETITLNDTTALSAHPVPNALYDQFIHDEEQAGRYHRRTSGPAHDRDSPAIGMHAADAERFITWLNDLTGTDILYRLPTPEELTDPAATLVIGPDHHTVWAHNGVRILLHQPHGVPWPYTPTPRQLHAAPVHDRQQTTSYLRALTTSTPQDIGAGNRISIFATALLRTPRPQARNLDLDLDRARARARARDPDLARDRARDLARDFTRAGDLARARAGDLVRDLDLARDLAGAGDLDLARDVAGVPDLDLAGDLNLASALVIDLATALALDLALTVVRARDRDRVDALDLASALDRALDLALAFGGALDLASTRDLTLAGAGAGVSDLARDLASASARAAARDRDLDLALDLDRARARARDLARSLDLARDLDLLRIVDLGSALDLARDLARDLAGDRASALARDLARPGDLARAHSLALDLARAHALVLAHDLGPTPGPASDLASDLAGVRHLARALGSDFDASPGPDHLLRIGLLAVNAFRCMTATGTAPFGEEPARDFTRLDDILSRAAATPTAPAQNPPEDPAATLRHVHHLLQASRVTVPPDQLQLIDRTADVMTAIRDRTAPSDTCTLACVRTALLAATAALTDAPSQEEVTRLLHLTWRSLATHYPSPDQRAPNQILLIAQTQ